MLSSGGHPQTLGPPGPQYPGQTEGPPGAQQGMYGMSITNATHLAQRRVHRTLFKSVHEVHVFVLEYQYLSNTCIRSYIQ